MPLAVDVPDPRRNWFRPCGASSVVANANPMLSAAIFTKIQYGMRRSDGKVYCAPRNISRNLQTGWRSRRFMKDCSRALLVNFILLVLACVTPPGVFAAKLVSSSARDELVDKFDAMDQAINKE